MNKIIIIAKDDGELKDLAIQHLGGEVSYIHLFSENQEMFLIESIEKAFENLETL